MPIKNLSTPSRIINLILIIVIVLSSICLVFTTEPVLAQKFSTLFWYVEAVSSCVFFAEYLYRFWKIKSTHPFTSTIELRIRYLISPLGVIDLFSFLPFFLIILGWSQTPQLMLLQLLRLFKLTRYSMAFHLLADVLKDEAESLMVSVVLMFIILIFASVGIYIFEHDVQPTAFGSIPKAMWWAIVTLTTVGYGDVTPTTVQGKIFATFITIAGVGLVSLPAGIIASGFTEQLRLRRERFQMEVESLIKRDGTLSAEDMEQLEEDRQELGLTKDNAQLIIDQVEQKAARQVKRRKQ